MSIRRAGVLAVVLALAAATPAVARPASPKVRCVGNPARVERLDITIEGTPTWGLYALPKGGKGRKVRPEGIVAVGHGYGHTPESWRTHLSRIASENNVIAFAMNYRGSSIVDGTVRGWQVQEGAEDTIHVARLFDAACRVPTIVAYGVSMGGNTTGLAVAAAPTRADDTTPLFDWWIDVEGAANVIETYQEARLAAATGNQFAVNAKADIERQMGGTFEEKPDTYAERTVVLRADAIAASGVRGVAIVHGVGDGLVPYNQSRELATGLRALGVAVQFFTVGTRSEDSEPGTTLDGYVPVPAPYESPFAGHASEASTTHLVGNLGFERLRAIFAGDPPADDRESFVDGATGVTVG